MRAHLLGVRGSTPAPGAEFARYGGHTSCVAVEDRHGVALVLDAGTGVRQLGSLLAGRPFRGAVLLSHLHWDHVQGLPFSPSLDHPEAVVDLHVPVEPGEDPESVLARSMGPPHFPITPSGLQGTWRFHPLNEGESTVGEFRVLVRDVPHKGGRTVGVRVEGDGASLAYVPDHAPSVLGPGPRGDGVLHPSIVALASGVDLLLHDSQHTAEEYPARAHYGHTTIDYSRELARSCDVARLVLFHHDPSRTDDELDDLAAAARRWSPPTVVAREGDPLEVG